MKGSSGESSRSWTKNTRCTPRRTRIATRTRGSRSFASSSISAGICFASGARCASSETIRTRRRSGRQKSSRTTSSKERKTDSQPGGPPGWLRVQGFGTQRGRKDQDTKRAGEPPDACFHGSTSQLSRGGERRPCVAHRPLECVVRDVFPARFAQCVVRAIRIVLHLRDRLRFLVEIEIRLDQVGGRNVILAARDQEQRRPRVVAE